MPSNDTNNCSLLVGLYCLVYDQANKPRTAMDFNHYLIVIFAWQFRETETIFPTLHLIETGSSFVFHFQL